MTNKGRSGKMNHLTRSNRTRNYVKSPAAKTIPKMNRESHKSRSPSPPFTGLTKQRAVKLLKKWMSDCWSQHSGSHELIPEKLQRIKLLIETFPELVNFRNNHEETLIHLAAFNNWEEFARFLLEHQADPLMINKFHGIALDSCRDRRMALIVMGEDDDGIAQKLAETERTWQRFFSSNQRSYKSGTIDSWYFAVLFNREDILAKLAINSRPRQQVLDDLLRLCETVPIARMVSDAGANPRGSSEHFGEPAIFEVVKRRRVGVLKLMLEQGADANAMNNTGSILGTLFDHACVVEERQARKCAELLVRFGGHMTQKEYAIEDVLSVNALNLAREMLARNFFDESDHEIVAEKLRFVKSRPMLDLIVNHFGESIVTDDFLEQCFRFECRWRDWVVFQRYWYLVGDWERCNHSDCCWSESQTAFFNRRMLANVERVTAAVDESCDLVIDCVWVIVCMIFPCEVGF